MKANKPADEPAVPEADIRIKSTVVRVTRACLLLLWVALLTLPCRAELTEDRVKYDPEVKAQAGKTGAYRLSVKAVPYRTYLETLDHFKALKDRNQARAAGKKYTWLTPNEGDPDFSYEVYTPETYDENAPAGLLVFINSGDNGTINTKYRDVLKAKNLIVIGANKSGNKIDTAYRLTYAFYAVELMKRRYNIDPERVYITGNSGGGRAASHAMFYRPQLFKGGLPMVGCMAPLSQAEAFRLKAPPMHAMPGKSALKEAALNGRYVFLTGEKDFNRKECEAAAAALTGKGFRKVTVMVERGLGHSNPSPAFFEKALSYVDAPLIESAEKEFAGAKKDIQRKRLSDALTTLTRITPHLRLGSEEKTRAQAAEARQLFDELNQQYRDAIDAIDKAIANKDANAAQVALRAAQQAWRERLSRDDLNAYRKKILEVKRGD